MSVVNDKAAYESLVCELEAARSRTVGTEAFEAADGAWERFWLAIIEVADVLGLEFGTKVSELHCGGGSKRSLALCE